MEEPNALIRWVIFLFGGGDAALLAIAGLAGIATLTFIQTKSRFTRPQFRIAAVFFFVAILFCSSPPFPVWFVLVSLIGTVGLTVWNFLTRSSASSAVRLRQQKSFVGLLIAIWFVAAIALQVPFLVWSEPTQAISEILIIGDSITAGLNDGDNTWPRQLAMSAGVRIADASQPGATLKSAQTQNSLFRDSSGVLILEIGGNDLLEGLAVDQFERDLDQLLKSAVRPDRLTIMFELPLPPLCARYGCVQRSLARKYSVKLIPKRLFAGVLTTTGATVDGIHLSNRGHTVMMKLIKQLLGKDLNQGSGQYQRIEPDTTPRNP